MELLRPLVGEPEHLRDLNEFLVLEKPHVQDESPAVVELVEQRGDFGLDERLPPGLGRHVVYEDVLIVPMGLTSVDGVLE